MATTLLDQVKISPAIRTGAKYRTSETAEWVIPLKGDAAATTARIVVLIDGTETTAETANLNTRTLRIIHQILTKEQWQGRSLRNQVIYALERANKWLYDQALETHNVGRLGASIMVAIFTDRSGVTVELLHVGTCRALLIRGGERYQLTVEHTRGVDFAAKTGSTISDWSPTRFLGAASTVEVATNKALAPGGQLIDRSEFQLDLRDRLLLCSAGVKPVAVERFLPHMPESNSRTIAQELVGYQNEPAIGNATAIVALRDGARRRLLPYIAIVIAALALAVLLFWPQLSRSSAEAWSQLAQMAGLQPPIPTATTSLEPTSAPITTTVAMTTIVSLSVTVTTTTEPTATETQTATALPTASPTPTATATQTATAMPSATASGLTKLTPTVTRPPTNTPVPTATSTNTPVAQATPTYTPTAPPVAAPTATPTLTPTGVTTAALKPGPQPLARSNEEYSYLEGAKGAITFKWSAMRDVDTNEVYHFEIIDPSNGNRIVHSNDPVLRQLVEAEDVVDISVLQGKGWLRWHVRTGVIEDGEFRATSEWSKWVEFKVTVKTEDNKPPKTVPPPPPLPGTSS